MTDFLWNIVLVVQVLSALAMIVLILLQHGKGADMGAAFGSGASGSLFGASGGSNVLSKATAILAGTFFVCTLALASHGNKKAVESNSVLEGAVLSAPAASAAAKSASAAVGVASSASAANAAQVPAK